MQRESLKPKVLVNRKLTSENVSSPQLPPVTTLIQCNVPASRFNPLRYLYNVLPIPRVQLDELLAPYKLLLRFRFPISSALNKQNMDCRVRCQRSVQDGSGSTCGESERAGELKANRI